MWMWEKSVNIDYHWLLCLCLRPPAPSRVTALQADNDHTTHSLTVSWERPVGVYDGYSLQLLDEAGTVLANRSVSVESRSERLEGLTSGKWYRVKVATLSGGVPSLEAIAEGQTRESDLQKLIYLNMIKFKYESLITQSWHSPITLLRIEK